MNMAVDDEIIDTNTCLRLGRILRTNQPREGINPLTKEDLKILQDTFLKHSPRAYPLVLTLARTGMRIGEAVSLRWGDIDFTNRFITVQRCISRGKIGTPKNGKGRRVDMSMQLTETLRQLKRQRAEETLRNGWREIPQEVFLNYEGRRVDPSHFKQQIFDKVVSRAGLRSMRIHDLRHTFASLLIQAGESLAYVRDQLGHHSIKMTVDIYGHLAPGGNRAAVDRLDDATICNLSATTV
jgi:integrase